MAKLIEQELPVPVRNEVFVVCHTRVETEDGMVTLGMNNGLEVIPVCRDRAEADSVQQVLEKMTGAEFVVRRARLLIEDDG